MAVSQTLQTIIDSMIRVDQAGEYGAVQIYKGQIKALKYAYSKDQENLLTKTLEEEQEHLDTFNQLAISQEVRPTFMQPLWHIGGRAMGLVTGLMGPNAVHACTQAVEEVIVDHYMEQHQALEKLIPLCDDAQKEFILNLMNTIEKCCNDEKAHRDEAVLNGANQAPAYPHLLKVIKTITKTAIEISKKI